MADICNPGETRRILDQYGIRARKKFGQNFLIDERIVRGIIAAADISREDCVLEIGPGIGSLTGLLSESAGKVICVEIDQSLRPVLEETLQDCSNVRVLWGDALKTDFRKIAEDYCDGKSMKAVANLPYYITTPILMHLLENTDCFESITVMVQKEVADRICSEPGTRDYGAITLAVQYYSVPEKVLSVPPSSFIPRPGVDSSVVCLHVRKEAPTDADPDWLFAVIRASFGQRRKTLANGIINGLTVHGRKIPVERTSMEEILDGLGMPAQVRGETLSLESFASLSEELKRRYQKMS